MSDRDIHVYVYNYIQLYVLSVRQSDVQYFVDRSGTCTIQSVLYMYRYNLKGPKVIPQNQFPIDLNVFSCNLQGGLYCVKSRFDNMLFLWSRVIRLKKTFFFAMHM